MVMENSTSSGERELPERWSAKRKAEIVLRLLRGEDLGEISREIQVAPQVIEEWRRAFLSGAEAGLKSRTALFVQKGLVARIILPAIEHRPWTAIVVETSKLSYPEDRIAHSLSDILRVPALRE
jgi:transposase-like protein